MPEAKETLANFLTPTIRNVVRAEVFDKMKAAEKLYGRPRLFNDLLSSQPLAFNLFGELQADLELATRLFRQLLPGRVTKVRAIDFEWSPGRGRAEYLNDRSAFDVFVRYDRVDKAAGFLGIEVKYHEDLSDAPGDHRERYDQVADRLACFEAQARPSLKKRPLQQLWRDHLLAGSLLIHPKAGFSEGAFAVLFPRDNAPCQAAVDAYLKCLQRDARPPLLSWHLETLVTALRAEGAGAWVGAFENRYLAFGKVDRQ